MKPVILLGPQRLDPTVNQAIRSLRLRGNIAIVTAGWQENESDDHELAEHLGGRTINLNLYKRAESVFRRDTELADAHRERQKLLREMQRLYRMRLAHTIDAAKELARRKKSGPALDEERADSFRAVRDLDDRHRRRIDEVHLEFNHRWNPQEREQVQYERGQVRTILGDVDAVAVAGGHVAVLLNRMRLFDIRELIEPLPIIAWSAGAMALSEQVVLFHDKPPQGPGNSEVLEAGLGIYPGVLPLPGANHRLLLDDSERVSFFARRYAPLICVPLDEGARLDLDRTSMAGKEVFPRLGTDGHLVREEVA